MQYHRTVKEVTALIIISAYLVFLGMAILPATRPITACAAGTAGSTEADGEQEDYDELTNPEKSASSQCEVVITADMPSRFQMLCAEDLYVDFSSESVNVTGTVSYESRYTKSVYVPEGTYITGKAGVYSDYLGEYDIQAMPETFTAKKGEKVTLTLSLMNKEDVEKKIQDVYRYRDQEDKDQKEADERENEEYQKSLEAAEEGSAAGGTNVIEEGSGITTQEWAAVQEEQKAATFKAAQAEPAYKNMTGETSKEASSGNKVEKEEKKTVAPVAIVVAAVTVILAVIILHNLLEGFRAGKK